MEAYIKSLKCCVLCVFSCAVGVAYGQNVYKTIDANGKVSYSSTAPENMDDVQTLAPPPEPTQREIDAAKQRQAEYQQQSRQREQAREQQKLAETQAQTQSTHTIERTVEQQYVPVPVTRRRPILRPPVNRPVNRPR